MIRISRPNTAALLDGDLVTVERRQGTVLFQKPVLSVVTMVHYPAGSRGSTVASEGWTEHVLYAKSSFFHAIG